MTLLGDLYFYDEYGKEDLSTAAYWYQKVYDSGNGEDLFDNLIYIYNKQKNYDASLKLLLPKIETGDTDALNEMAYYYAEGKGVPKDINRAIACIDKAISLAPDEPAYLDSKGEILLMKGDVKGATKLWKKINSTYPLYYQKYIKDNDGETTPLDEYMKSNHCCPLKVVDVVNR